ncbi:MAG: glycosyltransferase [Saprospiraceae bacterium]|nr:glycosyltransferase [Saprospiraceae bacterium]
MLLVKILAYLCFAIYTISLVYVGLFCINQFYLLFQYIKKNNREPLEPGIENLPLVTIQLPVFNEKYVVERLIDQIMKMQYPRELLEIQVLDDSTDDTLSLTQARVAQYKAQGYDIKVLHRTDRSGFKAGALKKAMEVAKGEFIAIFDADFMPKPDFLLRTLPHFNDPAIGVVQTRWEHLNEDYSLLTKLQAFQLNVHFTIEQKGRENGKYFLQFNGTAGVWRRTTIEDAGGWEADTLTEDLDLSYRAQLRGWKIHYMVDVTSPAELPAEMNGLKSQQYRWMKGGAENARKLLPAVWKSPLNLAGKLSATMHLLASSVFLFVFLLGTFSVPLLFLIKPAGIDMSPFTIFLASLAIISIIYFFANVGIAWKKENPLKMLVKFIFIFPIFMAMSMGLAFHNSIAVVQGLLGKRSDFVRTPKYGIRSVADSFKKASYFNSKLSKQTLFEGLLAVYFITAFVIGIRYNLNYFQLLHALLAVGYSLIFLIGLKHSRN